MMSGNEDDNDTDFDALVAQVLQEDGDFVGSAVSDVLSTSTWTDTYLLSAIRFERGAG
jgi:hypothetical protein